MLNFRFFVGNKITNYIYREFKHFSKKKKKNEEKNREWGETSILTSHAKEIFQIFQIFLSLCALPTLLIHSTSQSSSEGCGVRGGGGLVGAGTGRLGKLNT